MARVIPANEWLEGEVQQVNFAKKQVGKKGQLLVELQKSYKGDSRFKLNDRFDEVEVQKLPKRFKDLQQKLIEESEEEAPEEQDGEKQTLEEERNQQLNILTQLLPEHRAFISYQKKQDKKKYNLIVPKFDPKNINQKLIVKKETQQENQIQKKNLKNGILITKGVDKKTIKLEKANKLLARTDMKHKVDIKVDRSAWRDIVQNSTNATLFS